MEAESATGGSAILVYSRTVLYRHASIPVAIESIRKMGYKADFSEDASVFDEYDSIAQYDALVFLSPSGDILSSIQQKDNLARYIRGGGGLVGIHSATSCLRDVEAYTQAFGAILDRHAKLQDAVFTVHNHDHVSTACLPPSWPLKDEVYYFQSDPRLREVSLLLTVDNQSYHDPLKKIQEKRHGGHPHPIAWYRDGSSELGCDYPAAPGRIWYTSLGHTEEIWGDGDFLAHIRGGIDWVLDTNASSASM